ncbi:rCG36442 [Rattus norvegicus]|uniref:RCG36442 n=1 Tax=Rattus norvegicus TaxID=10116 RepID=A6IQ65_RAT|nr:rCG36442 [Rattus norvegicus]
MRPRNSNSAATAWSRSRRSPSRTSGPVVPRHYLEMSSAHPVQKSPQNHSTLFAKPSSGLWDKQLGCGQPTAQLLFYH